MMILHLKKFFREMYNYLENNLNYKGYMFNLISKVKRIFLKKLKNRIFQE